MPSYEGVQFWCQFRPDIICLIGRAFAEAHEGATRITSFPEMCPIDLKNVDNKDVVNLTPSKVSRVKENKNRKKS